MMKQTSITKNGFGGNYDSDDSGNYSGKFIFSSSVLLEQGERKMNKEELIKDQFPNDEFLQSGILQIVDKCTADLEKENAKLKKKVKSLEGNMSLHEGILWNDLHKLEKENAELKEQLGDKVMQKQKDKADLVWKLKTANEQKADQLTKAKEIIKKLMEFAEMDDREYEEEYKEAEQFINNSKQEE